MKKIILASTSPRRHKLMEKLGIPFEIEASDFEEDMTQDLSPTELAKELSKGKAMAVAEKHSSGIVIGADTFVTYQGKVLGKPKDATDAKDMLTNFSGQQLSVVTGFTIVDAETGQQFSDVTEAKVWIREMTESEIDEYIATGEPLDKAGAFAGQDLGSIFIEKIDGDFYTMVGLPLNNLVQQFPVFGIDLWSLRKAKP